MSAVTSLKQAALRVGRWGAANRVTRTVTAVTGVQGAFHSRYWRYRHARSSGRCTKSIDGTTVEFRASSPGEFRHCRTLMGERRVLRSVAESVRPGDVFFDVGAYVGVYACVVGAMVPSARVIAFEPDPRRLDLLAQNVAVNELDVETIGAVLGDATGTVSFATDRGSASPNCSRIATDGTGAAIERPVHRADDLVEDGSVPPPNVVKIDVEGAEVGVLRGMAGILDWPTCRVVYCEVHPTLLPEYGRTSSDVHALLAGAGFEVNRLETRGEEYFLRAERSPD